MIVIWGSSPDGKWAGEVAGSDLTGRVLKTASKFGCDNCDCFLGKSYY